MKSILFFVIGSLMLSVASFAGGFSENNLSVILQEALAENPPASSAEDGADINCQEAPPPGGWVSFPLACRRFVGQLQVAMDPEFHHVVMTIAIEQKGRLIRNSSSEVAYYFSLKLGAMKMKPENVVWQADRSYQIGNKISGLCNPELISGSSSVVCRAVFHGILGKVAGGYVETYYGPGLTQIKLESANSQDGHAPLLHWRAALREAK